MFYVNPGRAAALTATLLFVSQAPAQTDAVDAAVEVVDEVKADAAEVVETVEQAVSEGNPFAEAFGEMQAPVEPDDFENAVDRYSYAIGMDIGRSFKTQGVDINPQMLQEALGEAYGEGELRLSEAQAAAALQAFQMEMYAKMQAKAAESGQENRVQGEAFLEENAAREGVTTTASGLLVEVLEAGDGPTPGAQDTVRLHYTGKLIDGETFDSSEGGEPAVFPVGGVIPGFSEGLQLLAVGTKAKLYIPADLAYGDSPQGPGGPGSTLVFDVEMIGIEGVGPTLTLEEQIEQAQAQMEEDVRMIREQTEAQVKAMRSQIDAGGAATPALEPQYD